MKIGLIDKPANLGIDEANSGPLLIIQSYDFNKVAELYQKLCRVKAFLDEIAEEFVDAKSVKLLTLDSQNTNELSPTRTSDQMEYQIVVEYDCQAFNRLSKLHNPHQTLS